MKNRISNIEENKVADLKKKFLKDDSIYIAEVAGRDIQCKEDYLRVMSEAFQFPYPALGFDGYLDWMTDLSWLEKETYVLIIKDYKEFCLKDMNLKQKIIKKFEERILPFWEEQVKHVMVGGYPKSFNVYLVD